MNENELATIILDACFKIHRVLGPGLLETAYEDALCYELKKRDIPFVRQAHIPVKYEDITLGAGFRADLIVDRKVVVELKSTEATPPIFKKKLLNHVRLANVRLGLLINFNVPLLREGITRVANKLNL